MSDTVFHSHDHDHCIADCVAAVEQKCREAGLKLTPQRRRVLEILLNKHKALGAYDILEVLRAEGQTAEPPVAYRALDFLVGHGFAHKVERLNAFVACSHPGQDHAPALLICSSCRSVAEAPSEMMHDALSRTADKMGFDLQTAAIEAIGHCPTCVEATQ